MCITMRLFRFHGMPFLASKLVNISEKVLSSDSSSHDYHQNPDAQIEYFQHHRDHRWIMPNHSYSMKMTINPISQTSLEIIFVDTPILCPTETEETMIGGIHEVTPEAFAQEYAKVEQMLQESTATWLLVAGHYTIYSMAEHGDNPVLIDRLAPLLQRYGVQAYFNGHDHVLEAIEWEGVHYITSGHGADPPEGWFPGRESVAMSGVKFTTDSPGFTGVTANSSSLTYVIIDRQGSTLFSQTLSNPRPSNFQPIDPHVSLKPVFTIAVPVVGLLLVLACCLLVGMGIKMYMIRPTQRTGPDDYLVVNTNPLHESEDQGFASMVDQCDSEEEGDVESRHRPEEMPNIAYDR